MTYNLVAVIAILMDPAVDPATGTTVQDAIVSRLPLNLMTIGASLLLPLVAAYFITLYSAFSGPNVPEDRTTVAKDSTLQPLLLSRTVVTRVEVLCATLGDGQLYTETSSH
nr:MULTISPECIES: hypothetical protein [unclassified Haloarcula]